MTEYQIERLSDNNRYLLDSFSCVESDEMLKFCSAKERRRIRRHSQDMDDFIHYEAYEDQQKGLSVTYLFIANGIVVAYLSLCNDSIQLQLSERDSMSITYATVPALKIARLAVMTEAQGNGFGKAGIAYTTYIAQWLRKYSGIVFITLDCFGHRTKYYEQFGFVKNLIQPIELPYDSPISMRLWIDRYLETM